ncbi:MAG TPA: hypothetical protein VGE04_00585 [Chloroflexia bacterium]|jgi:hypothetical protein
MSVAIVSLLRTPEVWAFKAKSPDDQENGNTPPDQIEIAQVPSAGTAESSTEPAGKHDVEPYLIDNTTLVRRISGGNEIASDKVSASQWPQLSTANLTVASVPLAERAFQVRWPDKQVDEIMHAFSAIRSLEELEFARKRIENLGNTAVMEEPDREIVQLLVAALTALNRFAIHFPDLDEDEHTQQVKAVEAALRTVATVASQKLATTDLNKLGFYLSLVDFGTVIWSELYKQLFGFPLARQDSTQSDEEQT